MPKKKTDETEVVEPILKTETTKEEKPVFKLKEKPVEPKDVAAQQGDLELTHEEVVTSKEANLMMVTEEEKPELTEAEQTVLTEQKLLQMYEKAPQGEMLLGFIMVETGCHSMQKLSQMWDRLYSRHKVGFSKFYKP